MGTRRRTGLRRAAPESRFTGCLSVTYFQMPRRSSCAGRLKAMRDSGGWLMQRARHRWRVESRSSGPW